MNTPKPEERLSTSLVSLSSVDEFHKAVNEAHNTHVTHMVKSYCQQHGVPNANGSWLCSSHSLTVLPSGMLLLSIVGIVKVWYDAPAGEL
ncbi:hypothetical protein [Deinococcus sp. Leaf326]|uniref:hypothetical protein n=1 Tax=Deinococcus sp. Leaf326 TaxID=1736338 RepID=UPI0006FCF1BB|nr:hypothetical protein [Deinococcus sp. Leaf326]KQR40750.1 hypothetical protein ASF71_00855 [Deinococcus sp. Leaf326]